MKTCWVVVAMPSWFVDYAGVVAYCHPNECFIVFETFDPGVRKWVVGVEVTCFDASGCVDEDRHGSFDSVFVANILFL